MKSGEKQCRARRSRISAGLCADAFKTNQCIMCRWQKHAQMRVAAGARLFVMFFRCFYFLLSAVSFCAANRPRKTKLVRRQSAALYQETTGQVKTLLGMCGGR